MVLGSCRIRRWRNVVPLRGIPVMNTGAWMGRDSTAGQASSISSKRSKFRRQRRRSILNARAPNTLKSASSLQDSRRSSKERTNERSAKPLRLSRLKADSRSSSARSAARRWVPSRSLARTLEYFSRMVNEFLFALRTMQRSL